MLLPHVRRTIGDEMNDMTELLQSQASLLSLMMRNLSSLLRCLSFSGCPFRRGCCGRG